MTLNGGLGADTLQGGTQDDIYIVDDLNDKVKESQNSGLDTVQSSVTHILANNVENLILTGDGSAIDGTGNAAPNTLRGNSADNKLDGVAGNDNLDGEEGADKLNGGSGSDILTGETGNDIFVFGAVKGVRRLGDGLPNRQR